MNMCPHDQGAPRYAMTLVEIMMAISIITIAIFAILDNVFSLRRIQAESEIDRKVHMLAETMTERLMGCNWDQLGRWKTNVMSPASTTLIIDQTHNALSWHRRMVPCTSSNTCTSGFDASSKTINTAYAATTLFSPRLPPLQEKSAYGTDHDLLYQLANADERLANDATGRRLIPTGIPNVAVYVEYYLNTMVEDQVILATVPPSDWPTSSPWTPPAAWTYWTRGASGTGPLSNQYVLGESPGGSLACFAADSTAATFQVSPTKPVCIRVVITFGPDSAPALRSYETILVRRR